MRLTIPQSFAALMGICAVLTVIGTQDLSLRVFAISVAGIAVFATRSLPEIVTALALFLSFLAVDAAPPEVLFSGFATSGFWLLIGGLIIGTAIATSGLGDHIAGRLFALTGPSYPRAVLTLSLAGLILGIFVPSAIPRVIVMMPITLALARTMGLSPGSRGHTGLLMSAAMMTLLPTYAFLTANLPTIVEMGAIEILYGSQISYGAYFVQNAPMNALRFVVLLALLLAYGRGVTVKVTGPKSKAQNLTQAQQRLLLVLACAIAFWATDFWHGIAPAWVALTAAMVLLLPGMGVFAPQAMRTDIDLSIAFLIASVFCISAVITDIGLGTQIANIVVPALYLGQGSTLWDLSAVAGFSSALSHLTIAPAAPIVLAPLAAPISEATGWSIETVAMAQNLGFSTTVLPYQSPPLLIGIVMAQMPVGALTRLCVVSALITTVLGVPLTWSWWMLLGLL